MRCLPDAGVSPDGEDDSEPRGDGVEDDGEVSMKQRKDCPRKRELGCRWIVVLDRCMDREWNVLNHDHEISDCQSCEDAVRRAEHFLPGAEKHEQG